MFSAGIGPCRNSRMRRAGESLAAAAGASIRMAVLNMVFSFPGQDLPTMRLFQRPRNDQPRRRGGLTSARMIPRTAFTSRDDQPLLVKMVRIVFLVARVREGGWK